MGACEKLDLKEAIDSEKDESCTLDSFGMRGTLAGAIAFFEGLDTPRSLMCAMLVSYGQFSDLMELVINPRDYLHASDFKKDYAATKYLSKLQGLRPKSILQMKALSSFKSAEDRCASTNMRISSGYPLPGAEALIFNVREKISRILGPLVYDDVVRLCDWGPGATATLKAQDVRPENKLLEPRLSVTKALYPIVQHLIGADLHWARARLGNNVDGPCCLLSSEFQLVEYMRVVTVDKDSKTDRTIGAEPTLNTYVQKGIGRTIRKRLRRVGVDLDDQRINQTWAELALSLDLATVDLSSASDLISYGLVELLLPPDWFRLLRAARSGYALLPVEAALVYPRLWDRRRKPPMKLLELEKFSSMGNGYTFELETLIFYAIASAVVDEVGASSSCVSVYGDDIIVPQAAYSRLVDVFQIFGFKINEAKSYSEGLFFESCGEHFFNGVNVTPVYQKETVDALPQLVRAHNRLARWGDGTSQTVYVDGAIVLALNHYDGLMKHVMRHLDCGPHKGSRPGLTPPRVPWGCEGDDGAWSFVPGGFFCPDRGLLCKVVLMKPIKVETTSYDALLAISLRRSDGKGPLPWNSTADKRLADLCKNATTQPWEGQVDLRGQTGYRLTRRWFQLPLTRKQMFA